MTVGGSVLIGRKKYMLFGKCVLYFLEIKFSKLFKFYIELDERKLIFVIQIGQFYKNNM